MRRGQATAESTFVLMVLALTLFGGFEIARGLSLKHSLDSGAYLAARWWSYQPRLDEVTRQAAETLVRQEVERNVGAPSAAGVRVRICGAAQPSPCPAHGAGLDDRGGAGVPFTTAFRVDAEVPFGTADGRPLPFLGSVLPGRLRAGHAQTVEKYP